MKRPTEYEVRVCDNCGRESLPRARRVRHQEVACAECGGHEFTVHLLERQGAGHTSRTPNLLANLEPGAAR